jgi:hypothetical protein
VDDDVNDRHFRETYTIPLNRANTTNTNNIPRSLRGMIDRLEDNMDDDDITNNDTEHNYTLYIKKKYVYDEIHDYDYNKDPEDLLTDIGKVDNQFIYVIVDNVNHNIIYSIVKNYCVINTEYIDERRDM